MGPHSFKCGKEFNGTNSSAERMSLQWGRTLSSAERNEISNAISSAVSASMGPHSFKCGKPFGGSKNSTTVFMLQWGRTLSSAERALSFVLFWWMALLQWGRTLSSAERAKVMDILDYEKPASMGPHSFKCGKLIMPSDYLEKPLCFNGAALFQVRKESFLDIY